LGEKISEDGILAKLAERRKRKEEKRELRGNQEKGLGREEIRRISTTTHLKKVLGCF